MPTWWGKNQTSESTVYQSGFLRVLFKDWSSDLINIMEFKNMKRKFFERYNNYQKCTENSRNFVYDTNYY